MRDIADPVTAHPTIYDRSPVEAFSTSNSSSSLLETSPSDSGSSQRPTFPSIDRYASEASFASPLFGGGDSSQFFAELSPFVPGSLPFLGSTGSDSPGDSLGGLTFPGFVPGPATVFPDFGAGTVGDWTYATSPQTRHQRQLSIDDRLMMTDASFPSNKRARVTPEADGIGSGGAMPPKYPGAGRPSQPPVPRPPASFPGATQKSNTRLRSASTISKNFADPLTETPQERKERNSHNMVEKQYRNRLNAKYENLLNSLPEEMRSPSYVKAGGNSGASSGHVDKPLSKGEVLDKSTAYIHELEWNNARLNEENAILLKNIESMSSMLAVVGLGNSANLGMPEGR